MNTRYGLTNPKVYTSFMRARDRHFNLNKHHFHKVEKADKQTLNTKLEMIADWYSTNRTIHETSSNTPFPSFRDWYNDKRQTLKIGPEVIAYIDNYLVNQGRK